MWREPISEEAKLNWKQFVRRMTVFRLAEVGGSSVELAMIFPFLVLLVIGVVDYTRVFSSAITVANAAKAGAQYGAQSTLTSGDTAHINEAGRLDAGTSAQVAVTSSRVCRCSDGAVVNCATGVCGSYGAPRVYVIVTAAKAVRTLIDYPGLPSSISLARTATLRAQ